MSNCPVQVVQFALAEDAGELGDVTTLSTYASTASAFVARRLELLLACSAAEKGCCHSLFVVLQQVSYNVLHPTGCQRI